MSSVTRMIAFASVSALAMLALSGCAGGSGSSGGSSGGSASAQPTTIHTPQDFTIAGAFVETCSCAAPCGCEMVGLEMGCTGVGALEFASGTYAGTDLAGAKVAYATVPGEWVRIYVDAAPKQRAALEEFVRAVYAAYGNIESVRDAKVEIGGSAGEYSVMVDAGTIMSFQTQPVLGGDRKTPVGHTNINDALNPTLYQGKGVQCTFKDGMRKFKLQGGTNAFFNDRMSHSGKI